jgi:hypothetical protein
MPPPKLASSIANAPKPALKHGFGLAYSNVGVSLGRRPQVGNRYAGDGKLASMASGKELARCRTLRLGPFPVPPHKNHS